MPVDILLSYAERDSEGARELERHLTPLARTGKISLWHRERVIVGSNPEREWQAQVQRAPIIILLVSADLEIDRDSDITDALAQRQQRGARVIPVLWRPVNIKDLRYRELRMIPDGKAVTERRDRDQAWVEVVQGIRKVVETLAAPGFAGPVTPPVGPASASAAGATGVLKILFLGANPSDRTQLNLPKERHEIDRRIQAGSHRDRFELKDAWAVTAEDLSQTLLRYNPGIVHFSGHGLEQGEILLNDESGKSAAVPAAALSRLFKLFAKKGLRCVVLNACYSAVQASAMAQHVDCVIGISGAIEDRAAQAFTSGFYAGLAQGESVQTAFELGCVQIELLNLADAEMPQLLGRDGVDLNSLRLV